jgi:hypothetical protein
MNRDAEKVLSSTGGPPKFSLSAQVVLKKQGVKLCVGFCFQKVAVEGVHRYLLSSSAAHHGLRWTSEVAQQCGRVC